MVYREVTKAVRTPEQCADATWSARSRTRLRARRTGARHGDTSDQIQFAIQFSKFRNSENYQLSEKSPKTKVVEEL
jgi:hypothetical protein